MKVDFVRMSSHCERRSSSNDYFIHFKKGSIFAFDDRVTGKFKMYKMLTYYRLGLLGA